ncbi:Hypothetical protein ORPV_277 [Orpheovirus IHUMI-LCC2]|uniref:Uncharacterized protein n=1 Tax=Orpheovirus IHUMI-LCC2 TaxID=2023057 RepID=A0A2I2L3U2_9VIRU|nr:Hypothetical protein ORPV_277 [Orpheovirus IHUMI-LCC2]SNW62181.1 Hypothetical protein ORPV_277 [Orpheovirus IHUMI-LCC2]
MEGQIDNLLHMYISGVNYSYPIITIPNLIMYNSLYRDVILRRLPYIISLYPNIFPTYGTIIKKDDFYYIRIDDKGSYTNLLYPLLASMEYGYGYNKLIPQNYVPPVSPGFVDMFKSPSPVGSHISISQKINPQLVGNTVNFQIDLGKGITDYASLDGGVIPSPFNPWLYPLRWYLLNVTGLPSELFINYKFNSHITIGVLAYLSTQSPILSTKY